MPSFITESIFYKGVYKFFINPYEKSFLKTIVNKFSLYFKQSFIYKCSVKYINKSPYFLNSFSYKVFRKFIAFIDKIMDIIHNFFAKLITESEVYKEANNIKKKEFNKKLLIVCILISALNLGYLIGGITFNTTKPFIVNTLLILCIALYIFSLNSNYYKQSFIYKFIKYLF